DRIVLGKYAPAGVVINDAMEILQFRGQTGTYLEPAAGEASFNLLKMVRRGLLSELRAAIQEAKKKCLPVRKKGLKFESNNQFRNINIEVIPMKMPTSKTLNFLILFEDSIPEVINESGNKGADGSKPDKAKQKSAYQRVIKLEQE